MMRSLLIISVVLLVFAGCDSGPDAVNPVIDPDLRTSPIDSFDDDGLIAFVIFYELGDAIAVAPLNNLQSYAIVAPVETNRYFLRPRFSPTKDRIIISRHSGPALLFDIGTNTLSELIPSQGSWEIIPAEGFAVWDRLGRSFLYSEWGGVEGGLYLRRYELTTQNSEPVAPNHYIFPLASINDDSLLVLAGSREIEHPGPHLQLYRESSDDLHIFDNAKLYSDPSRPGVTRRSISGDWNPTDRLIATTTSQSSRSIVLFITNLDGSEYEAWKTYGRDAHDVVWGPNRALLYSAFPDDAPNNRGYQLWGLNTYTDQHLLLLDASMFPGADGVGYADF